MKMELWGHTGQKWELRKSPGRATDQQDSQGGHWRMGAHVGKNTHARREGLERAEGRTTNPSATTSQGDCPAAGFLFQTDEN